MASLRELRQLLNELEARIDVRVITMENQLETQRKNGRVLRRCLDERDRRAKEGDPGSSGVNSVIAEESNKLDKILDLARNISAANREGLAESSSSTDSQSATLSQKSKNEKQNSSNSSKIGTKSTEMTKPGIRQKAVAKSVVKPTPLRTMVMASNASAGPENAVEMSQASVPTLKHIQVEQQLLLLNRQRVLARLKPLFLSSSQLFNSQHMIVKSIQDRVSIPASLLLQTLSLCQHTISSNSLEVRSKTNTSELLTLIETELRSIQSVLSRSSISKIVTLPQSHFSVEQCLEFFELWYRSQLVCSALQCLLHHSHSTSDGSQSSTWKAILATLCDPMILPLPSLDDLVLDSKLGSSPWLRKQLEDTRSIYRNLENQISFWVEKYSGRNIFPRLIRELKQTSKCTTPIDSQQRLKWIGVLKQYQIMYSLSVNHARELSSCVFIDRPKNN